MSCTSSSATTHWPSKKEVLQALAVRSDLCLVHIVLFLSALQVTTPDDMTVAEAFLKVWELAVKKTGPEMAKLPVTVLAAEVQGDNLAAPAVL